jgi:hypothetical protein
VHGLGLVGINRGMRGCRTALRRPAGELPESAAPGRRGGGGMPAPGPLRVRAAAPPPTGVWRWPARSFSLNRFRFLTSVPMRLPQRGRGRTEIGCIDGGARARRRFPDRVGSGGRGGPRPPPCDYTSGYRLPPKITTPRPGRPSGPYPSGAVNAVDGPVVFLALVAFPAFSVFPAMLLPRQGAGRLGSFSNRIPW